MRLDVLGSSGSHTGPGRACSGYLVRTDSATVMLDAGNGSTMRLHQLVELSALDAVLISHGHVDHCIDLLGMHYALRTGGGGGIPLYAPAGVLETLATLSSREAPWALGDSFVANEITAGDELAIGDVGVAVHHAVHSVPAVSLRLASDGEVLTYSGDSAGGPELVDAARDADLLLCEATWQGDAEQYPPGIHLTARGAGRLATEAGVEHLVLTHVAGLLDRRVTRAEASETFHGRLTVAEDGDVLP